VELLKTTSKCQYDKVLLIFGGGSKDIFAFDYVNNTVREVEEAAIPALPAAELVNFNYGPE